MTHSKLTDDAMAQAGALYIRSMRFSPDGALLITGGEDKVITVGVSSCNPIDT
jgi:hypothetical protein